MAKLILSKARPALPWAAARAGDDYGAPAEPSWRDVDWQPRIHHVEVDGGSVNYVDYGDRDGTPVIFIHGLGGCWQNWLEQIPRVAELGRRVIALDLPGFGLSDMPQEEISIPGYGRCIKDVCERLSLQQVALVGHSTGGFVSAEMAIQYPELVDRIVLHSSAGLSITHLRRQPVLTGSRLVAAIGTRTATAAQHVVVRPRLRPLIWGSFIRHPTRIRTDFLYEITRGAGRQGFVPTLNALMSYDFRERLPEIRCPTLIVWGRDDMLVPVEDADEFERLIENSRKVIFDDTGHSGMIERPRRFNDCIVEFLESPRDTSADPAAAESTREREAAAEASRNGGEPAGEPAGVVGGEAAD
jgi:pimeloyl-ACP methyl ester carboxylesterase